jgi:diguanylate cyclase (GGDEF)-like protein
MSLLISAVADMTGQRDRDLLEVTVAEVLFGLLDVQRIALWKVIPHNQGARVRLMAGLESGQVVAMSDPAVEPEMLPRIDHYDGFSACFESQMPLRLAIPGTGARRHVYPVTSEREPVGLLEIESAADLSDSQDLVVAGLLRIYRNHLSLLDYSEHDTLTGLLNRRTFDDIFTRRVSRQGLAIYADREVEFIGHRRVPLPGEAPWLLVVDIDYFKRINDRFGHLFGDEVLLLMARFMRSVFRPHDVLFRFGGEEFVVLLAPTDALGAEAAAERFRASVENFPFPQVGRVTVSVGYTRVSPDDTPFGAFGRGDEALYYAKQHGRNRVVCHEALVKNGEVELKKKVDNEVELF